jgi:hypothetical protein
MTRIAALAAAFVLLALLAGPAAATGYVAGSDGTSGSATP